MIKDKETICGRYKANENNPLGLFRQGNQYYQLIGFFHYMDVREYMCDMRGTLPFSRFADGLRSGFNIISPWENDSYSEYPYFCTVAQMRHFKFDDTEMVYLNAYFKISYIFKVYRKPISFKIKVPTKKEQAICDFLHHNEFVPQIMSENRIAKEMSILSSGESTFNSEDHIIVDKKLFTKSIDPENHPDILSFKIRQKFIKEKYSPESIIERQTEAERREPNFELFADYTIEGERLNIDLLELHERIKKQAEKKGGFVDFEYKSKNYKIPLIPLIAWSLTLNSLTNKRPLNKFKLNNITWYTQSSDSIKTDRDNLFHTDWWIGAGFPIETYVGTFKYRAFNEALSNFVFDVLGKNTLNDVSFLAGKNLSVVTGDVVKYPSSLDDFNEDDVIILPHGGVDFDLYIKKACKNNKGAVIVEVGNKVAHLTIVSREYNAKGFEYRLILLPDASNLLRTGTKVKIDPINNKIIPI